MIQTLYVKFFGFDHLLALFVGLSNWHVDRVMITVSKESQIELMVVMGLEMVAVAVLLVVVVAVKQKTKNTLNYKRN